MHSFLRAVHPVPDLHVCADIGRDIYYSEMSALCDGAAKATDSERRLAWTGDAIDIALPATVRYRSGEGSDIVVRGAPDIIAHVELSGGRLTLNCRWHTPSRDIEVTLPGRPIFGLAEFWR